MFTINEGTLDRLVRLVLGVLLVYVWYAAFVTGALAIIALVAGILLAFTGVVGWCPLYSVFGMSTCPTAR